MINSSIVYAELTESFLFFLHLFGILSVGVCFENVEMFIHGKLSTFLVFLLQINVGIIFKIEDNTTERYLTKNDTTF